MTVLKRVTGKCLKKVADLGYGSEDNYEFMQNNGI
jgi:hypothetical protein